MGSFVSIGGAWAEVAGTPLSYFKTTTYEGGTQTPLIVAGGPVTRRGLVTDQLLHVADILPTVLEWTGAVRPTTRNGEGNRWQLYNLEADPRERDDLAQRMPDKVAALQRMWDEYAEYVGYIEADGTSAVEELGGIDRFFTFELPDD